jgi:hypothetical protein
MLPTPDELALDARSEEETPLDAAEVRWDPWLLRLYLEALVEAQRQRLD